MKNARYRIVLNNCGRYEIEERGLFFGWNVLKEDGGSDPLGFPYPDIEKTFKSIEDAEKHISDLENRFKRTVIKEIE